MSLFITVSDLDHNYGAQVEEFFFLLAMIDATDMRANGQVGHMYVNVHPLHATRGAQCFTNIISIYGPLILYKVDV